MHRVLFATFYEISFTERYAYSLYVNFIAFTHNKLMLFGYGFFSEHILGK